MSQSCCAQYICTGGQLLPENTETKDTNNLTAGRSEIGPLEALWVFFSSMKTAIVLLLILAAASIAGTIIQQNQPDDFYIRTYGQSLYSILKTLGLTDVYHSIWFMLLMGLVGVNLAVCSINRFGIAWRRTFRPEVAAEPDRIMRMARSEKIACKDKAGLAASKIEAALRERSYCVVKENVGEKIALYAAKGRLSIWGPYLTHLSILVIFAGAALGGLMGFEGYVTIPEGGRVSAYYPNNSEKPKDLGFSVALVKFKITHDQHRNPTGYKSDLIVYDNGKQVARKVIDVNRPLSYEGISFYQSGYGLSHLVLRITAPSGKFERLSFALGSRETEHGTIYGIIDDQAWKLARFGDKKLAVFVHDIVPDYVSDDRLSASMLPLNPAARVYVNDRFPEYKGLDAWKPLGWLAESQSAKHNNYEVTVEKFVRYTGLQVAANPALPIVYAGFGLMLVGVFVSFYINHRIIRVIVEPADEGSVATVGARSRAESDIFGGDFEKIRQALA